MSDVSNDEEPVVVIGGTGKTGRRVASRLAQRQVPVRPASRSTPVRFAWDEPDTWDAALQGAGAAYITYSPDLAFPGAAQQVGALAEMLRERSISRVVLLSGRGEEGAVASERALLTAVPSASVVSCSFFAQNFTEGPFLSGVLEGHIALPVSPEVAELFTEVLDGRNVPTTATVEQVLGRPATPVDVTFRLAARSGCFDVGR